MFVTADNTDRATRIVSHDVRREKDALVALGFRVCQVQCPIGAEAYRGEDGRQ